MTFLFHRGLYVRLSSEPVLSGSECPLTSSEDTDATVVLSASGGLLCPSGALHAWTEMRRAGRGGVTFVAVRWDSSRRRMAAADSVDCFGGRLTAQPVVAFTSDFRGILQGVHVAVSTVRKTGVPSDENGGGVLSFDGEKLPETGEGLLLRYVSEVLGFSYSVRLVSDDTNQKSFNQQEQLLANNTVDMTANALTQTVRRSSMMRFAFPTTTFLDRVAIGTPRLSRRPFKPERPFSRSAWVGVTLLLTLISLWMAGCQALAIFSAADGRRSGCHREATFVLSWWALAAMVCRQYGSGFSAPTRPCRAVLGFLCVSFTFLVSSYYSSVIHSFMALESPQLPYSSVQHGLRTGRLQVSYPKEGVMERKVTSARDPLLQQIADAERARPAHVDFLSAQSDQLGTWLQAGPQHGFLLSEHDLEAYRALHGERGCSVCLLPELVSVRPSGLAYSRQFGHSRLLDLQLLRLRELGLLQHVTGQRRPPGVQPLCRMDAGSAQWQSLSLEDLSAVFALVPSGAALALLVLAAERMVHLIARLSAVEPEPSTAHIP